MRNHVQLFISAVNAGGIEKRSCAVWIMQMIDVMRIHYNFIRPHQALKGQTPAEVAGINLNLGENRVEDLMRQAALKKKPEMYVTALGIRADKIEYKMMGA